MSKKTEKIVKIINSILPKRRPIEHHEPFIDRYDLIEELVRAVNIGITGYQYTTIFENLLKEAVKVKHAILTSSGTSALETSIRVLGINPGEEILVPSSTFVGTANAIVHAGCIPHFIDSLDPIKLREYLSCKTFSESDGCRYLSEKYKGYDIRRKISAIIVVHLFGLPADIKGIIKVAKEFKLKIIEDSAQALGSSINGKCCGTFGDIGIYSFNNNKIVTTNGGGAIVTNNAELAEKALHYVTTARIPHKWFVEHDQVAYNHRMGNINATLGCSQLLGNNFDEILSSKRALAIRYRHNLESLVEFVESPVQSEPNYWLNTILVEERDELLNALHNEGIRARAVFTPLHRLPMYYESQRSANVMHDSDHLFKCGICLPSGSNL